MDFERSLDILIYLHIFTVDNAVDFDGVYIFFVILIVWSGSSMDEAISSL